jgi:hypothetical protein
MEKKEEVTSNKYISRIYSYSQIDELSRLLKEFLKDFFSVKYEYTFSEIAELVKRKHIESEAREEIIAVCQLFEELEYKPKKPSKAEIEKIKKLLKLIIKQTLPDEKKGKKHSLFNDIADNIEKKKRKKELIDKKVDKIKEDITQNIIKKVKEKIDPAVKDSEYMEILRFISTSERLGIKKSQITKELKEMGFKKEKIDAVYSEIKD